LQNPADHLALRVCAQIVFFKLLGTGVLAAISGATATNREAGLSCAYAAAVNTVACAFYVLIWSIRAQNFSSTHAYGPFMLTVGRGADYKKEQAANAQKLFAQETSVDGLRHSDWTVRYACALSPCPIPLLTPRLLFRSARSC
jgi:hypothetical protein